MRPQLPNQKTSWSFPLTIKSDDGNDFHIILEEESQNVLC